MPLPVVEVVSAEDIEADMVHLTADQLTDFLDSSDVKPKTT